MWRALGCSVDVAWFGIRQGWRWTPGLLLRLMLTSLVVAVTLPRRCWCYQTWCGQQVKHTAERLSATEVTVAYPDQDRPGLTGFSLDVEVGKMVGLVGANGAGKTTAINALLGILDLDHGRVEIDGVDAATLSPGRRLSHFGLLTQEFGRYDLTIRDSVRLGTAEPVIDDQIWAALDAAHIGDLVRGLPDGLDTQLGPQFDGIGLSGGQWQRHPSSLLRRPGSRPIDAEDHFPGCRVITDIPVTRSQAAGRTRRASSVRADRREMTKPHDHPARRSTV